MLHLAMFSRHLSNITFPILLIRHEDTEAESDAGVDCSLCIGSTRAEFSQGLVGIQGQC